VLKKPNAFLECGGNEKPTLYQASRRHRFGRCVIVLKHAMMLHIPKRCRLEA